MAVLLLTAAIQLAGSTFHLIRTSLETFPYFCPPHMNEAQVMCVIPKFSACQGEHCGADPGQRLQDSEAGQTQQETQWESLTTFNSRTGLCFSINSHIKQQELRANT